MERHAAEYVRWFAPELEWKIEYSFGAEPDTFGTMVKSTAAARVTSAPFMDRAAGFVAGVPFAHVWWQRVEEFARSTQPTGYFFKVDWSHGLATRLTIYFRFDPGISPVRLAEGFSHAGYEPGPGSAPSALSAIVRSEPTVVALRVDAAGDFHSSAYHFIRGPGDEVSRLLVATGEAFGMPEDVAQAVGADFDSLYEPGTTENGGLYLGAKASPDMSQAWHRFYIASVSMRRALAFVCTKGAAWDRAEHLGQLVGSLEPPELSYVSAGYDSHGIHDWKLYLPLRPRSLKAMPNVAHLPTGEEIAALFDKPLRRRFVDNRRPTRHGGGRNPSERGIRPIASDRSRS
ncbi:MAG: hypothetical protein ACRDP8_14530 [Actinopolymorphaceae bacterium]